MLNGRDRDGGGGKTQAFRVVGLGRQREAVVHMGLGFPKADSTVAILTSDFFRPFYYF